MTYIKRSGGGVALRATFAALIALGSIPGAAAVSPNFSNIAFAATRGSSNQSSDTCIDNLTTAADWVTIGYISGFGKYDSNLENFRDSSKAEEYKNSFLYYLKTQLSQNTVKKEIPINDSYADIEPALTTAGNFYELYAKVTGDVKTYTTCSDLNDFIKSITSKPKNDTDVFLHDLTSTLMENVHDQTSDTPWLGESSWVDKEENYMWYHGSRNNKFNVCGIESQCVSPTKPSDYSGDYKDNYDKYHDYWYKVLSGLGKNWSFSYDTPSGCMLPSRLQDESQRLYNVDGKPKYLVQSTFEVFQEYTQSKWVSGNRYSRVTWGNCGGIERFSYELPLHTIAKFVKDVTVAVPNGKVPVENPNSLTDPELQAIRKLYIPAFQEALKDDKTLNKGNRDEYNAAITKMLNRADTTIVQKGSNIVISVPGIKTQVVPVKDITTTLDEFKAQAGKDIDAAATKKKDELKKNQGTSTDKEVKDAQDKVDQLANAAKEDINKNAANANDVNSKKDTAIQNINKVTAENAALAKVKQQAAQAIDAAATKKKDELKKNQGTSTDKEVKDAQDKVDQIATAAKEDINKETTANANDVNSKKDTAIQNINKVTAENAALAKVKQQAAQAIDAAATKKKDELKKNQGTSTDKEVKDAQDKVDQIATAAKEDINNNAANANDVNSKKDTAIQNINKVTAENKALQNSKKGAKDKLKDYGLSEDEQKPFIKEIDDAKDDKGINDALLNAAKAALKKKIGEAEKKQKEIAYTSASTEKKTAFDEKLKAAKDVRDKAGAKIGEITEATKALNTAMDNLDGRAPDTKELYALHTMYRLYNPYSHEHLFTTDENEKDNLVTLGWRFEGTVGKVYMHGEKGGVYRLYNPTTGEHHYTTKEDEVAACVKAGWRNEGVKFFSVLDADKQTVGVVSMYNPYEKKFYHHYTSDAGEIAKMVKAGWRKEEIKWYAAK